VAEQSVNALLSHDHHFPDPRSFARLSRQPWR